MSATTIMPVPLNPDRDRARSDWLDCDDVRVPDLVQGGQAALCAAARLQEIYWHRCLPMETALLAVQVGLAAGRKTT